MIKLGFADLPARASWPQLLGGSMLCGIGFTMSLFIGLPAFASDVELLNDVKVGILLGSLTAGLIGRLILRFAQPHRTIPWWRELIVLKRRSPAHSDMRRSQNEHEGDQRR